MESTSQECSARSLLPLKQAPLQTLEEPVGLPSKTPPDPSSPSFLPAPGSHQPRPQSGAQPPSSPLPSVSEVAPGFPLRSEPTAAGDAAGPAAGVPFTAPGGGQPRPGEKSGRESPSDPFNPSSPPAGLLASPPPRMLSGLRGSLGAVPPLQSCFLVCKVGCSGARGGAEGPTLPAGEGGLLWTYCPTFRRARRWWKDNALGDFSVTGSRNNCHHPSPPATRPGAHPSPRQALPFLQDLPPSLPPSSAPGAGAAPLPARMPPPRGAKIASETPA